MSETASEMFENGGDPVVWKSVSLEMRTAGPLELGGPGGGPFDPPIFYVAGPAELV